MTAPMDLIAAARQHIDTVSVNAGVWAGRGTFAGHGREVHARIQALDALDAALIDLHEVRGWLVSTGVRADRAVLAQYDAFDTYADNLKAATDDDA